MKKEYLETGKIVSTHGLHGDVKILPWADGPEFLLQFHTLYLDGKAYQVEQSRVQKTCVLLKLEGVDTVEAASALRDKVVSIARADAKLPEGSLFIADLLGLPVYDGETLLGTLAEVMPGADVFLGLSAGGVLKPQMVAAMAPQPVIFALANPTPEIAPERVREVRSDALIATGRSDYPNQVNNVLCFPYIFRGALDCGATTVTDAMKIATVHAIAELAQAEQSEVVAAAYAGETLAFGPEYLIPKPFDPRLMMKVAPAVARAAAESGVASRPIADWQAYAEKLHSFVYASGQTMRPIFTLAKNAKAKRVAFAEGEEERVLRGYQFLTAKPFLYVFNADESILTDAGRVAELRGCSHPDEAIAVYRRLLPHALEAGRSRSSYAEAAAVVQAIRDLRAAQGQLPMFADELAELRVEWKRKRNFIKLLEAL